MLSFGDFVFSKGGFLDDKNVDHFTIVENFADIFPKGLNYDAGQKFQISFVKRTLFLSFDDVLFSKGGFLDNKEVIDHSTT